ncbi:hypothetical protein ACN23B_28160 (plasmid) [Anabaena sp. FACHB-709]|uniref:Uncharacterized protein n=2 Tax=Nostocaceae TaxID=1162 RepID=A0A1Z4KVB5_ANAVA|nr:MULTISPECIES: hypothetical protein [Nostocaceae]BAY72961.1 hypothetical protein NIES23_57890 [Trichormus variabilis NIES-23]MBD2174174.1 hypothetical protein [Anabaena cylindrica FACHB-318]MBD2267029.1 hypothetical protein [Anabaena sp. FACHB-709]MBD2276579.1 hypothetical protein [Nostoc sp. PCC 7120 = FACHB-418]MBD2286330.1 hypothetical protein [Anabaena cylindrica FACHB-170]
MNQPPSKRKRLTPTTTDKPKPALKPAQEAENPSAVTVDIEAVEVPEMTEEEQRDRLNLERKVERAFVEAGKALMELRDRRLYRNTHKTFEEYCRDRFGYSRDAAYLKMSATNVYENIQKHLPTNGRQIPMPTNERQLRSLAKAELEPKVQAKVWRQAVQEAKGKTPSGRIVQDVIDRIRDRTSVPNPYQVGEICVLHPKDNPDLRGKSGYWGVVTHVGEYSCTVKCWDGDYTAKVEHLKSLELLEDDCKFMQQLCERLRRLHEVAVRDEAVDWLLQGLGKQSKPYLSALQAKLLAAVEKEYNLIWRQQK